MSLRLLAFVGYVLCGTAQAAQNFDGKTWWDTVKVIAADRYQGRDTGSQGERDAQAYIVQQLEALRVEPAGSNGYYQPVKLRTEEIVEADSHLSLVRDGRATPVRLGDEAYFSTRYPLAPKLDAALVFVDYGLGDFAGVDLKNKVAVFITGSPADMASSLSAHYQSRAERWKVLKAAGAIGLISIPNPASMEVSWQRMAMNRNHPSMELVGPEFDETSGAQLAVTFNPAFADMLLAGSGHTFQELASLAKDRKPLPHFALPVAVSAITMTHTQEVQSNNVVARIVGSDPTLKNDYVVLSAHIDHIGIGAPINGDTIYNGAMDNGSGSALLLDLARCLEKTPAALKRSVLFVWVTGEEKGLLGSKYFAVHPTVPPKAMIADINTDMFLPIVPLSVLTVYGLAESDLGERTVAVGKQLGLSVQADPLPLHNVFIRSDQYNFVHAGIPSVMVDIGAVPDSSEAKVLAAWRAERYHAPSDDTEQPVDLAAAAGYEEFVRALVIDVANAANRPQWKTDSFFRRYSVN